MAGRAGITKRRTVGPAFSPAVDVDRRSPGAYERGSANVVSRTVLCQSAYERCAVRTSATRQVGNATEAETTVAAAPVASRTASTRTTARGAPERGELVK